jgi:signal transduction histidine kinase
VAHEINNPLTTVAGFTELWLEEMGADNPMRPELEMVTKETRRAREVVSRLLDFARQRAPVKERGDLNQIVREGLDLVRHFLALHGIELSERYAADLPWPNVERGGLKQVILNLAHNAAQAMPQGGLLTVETGAAPRGAKPGVYVSVRDTGPGIAEENLRHLFEPFFTTKPPGEGTGLGLALSYGIIAEHGGDIAVESRAGEGAEFRVWIPVDEAGRP